MERNSIFLCPLFHITKLSIFNSAYLYEAHMPHLPGALLGDGGFPPKCFGAHARILGGAN